MPRRWRSVPLAASLAAILLLVAGLAIVFLNERSYQAQQLSETRVQAEILAASVGAALDFGDPAAAGESVGALRVNPQVLSASVYDLQGRLFAGYARAGASLPRELARREASPAGGIEVSAPVVAGDQQIGTVHLAVVREPWSRRIARYALISLFVIMAVLVAAVLGVAHAALRRVNRELALRAEDLAEANRELRVQIDEREKAEEQLRQAQKMQALGQLTGGIAHDFNNLLTVIQGSADILQRPGLSEEKRLRFAGAIAQTASRAASLTSQLLAFARRQPLRPEVIDLNEKIAGMADLLDRTLGERVEVRTELADGLCAVEADPAQLEAAILNIAVNARDAMPDGGVLAIRTFEAPAAADGGRSVALAISDSGEGIDAETLARVFEPFFTTKRVGKGTGLGLSQVYGFASQSGGGVDITSAPERGTTVTVTLPCTDRRPAGETLEADAAPRARGVGRILVVDDNEEVGAFAEILLVELGYEVLRARSGEEAVEIVHANQLDAVFSDVVMPGISGIELAERLRAERPRLPIILTTGYSDQISQSGAGDLPVVFKPYRLETVADALEAALGRGGDR
jgi:signal transduction histidine kinase